MMKRVGWSALAAALVALGVAVAPARAQSTSDSSDALRRQVERRFEVLTLRNSVVLRPLRPTREAPTSIEVTDDAINLDGLPATGVEVRARLGADADAVLQLSYLAPAARQRLFAAAPPSSPPPPAAPESAIPPAPPLPPAPAPAPRPRPGRDGNDRVRIGGSVTVDEGETIEGDVVAVGGAVRVDGRVTGNAVAIGGGLRLGPHAEIDGDAVAVGGGLNRDEGARIGGKVVDMPLVNFDFGQWRWNRSPFGRGFPGVLPFTGAAAGVFALFGTMMRLFVLCLLVSLVLFVGRDYVERVSACAAAEPLKAGAVGVLAQLLFLPLLVLTIMVLVITLIGIPLLVLVPFALLALCVVFLVGFTGVVYHLGRLANRRIAWHADNPYVAAILGILLVLSPILLARLLGLANWLLFPLTGTLVVLGLLAEYLAWTVGFGAVALLRFTRPKAPPAPSAAPPATA